VNFPGFCPSIRITFGPSYGLESLLKRIPSRCPVWGLAAQSFRVGCCVGQIGDHFRLANPNQKNRRGELDSNFRSRPDGFTPNSQNFPTIRCWISVRCANTQPHSTSPFLSSIIKMSTLNLQEIHDFAVDVAKKAGQMILKASNTRLSSSSTTIAEKKNCAFSFRWNCGLTDL